MSQLNPKKILLIKHGSLGDIVFALEPILAIRNKFNNSVINLVTEEKFVSFFKKIKMFDQFLVDNRGGILSTLSLIIKIISGKYDLIIDLQNSKRTNFYHFFIKIFSRSRINGSRSFAHDRYVIPPQGKESPMQGLFNQLKLLDIDKIDPDFSWLVSDKEDQSFANKEVVSFANVFHTFKPFNNIITFVELCNAVSNFVLLLNISPTSAKAICLTDNCNSKA